MSDSEIMVSFASLIVGVILWLRWIWRQMRVSARLSPVGLRLPLYVTPWIAMTLLFLILRRFADELVRDDPAYLALYTLMGLAWTGVFIHVLAGMGLCARDDVAERNNAAAVPALIGAILGSTGAFAGGNIGDGPGWWVVVFSSGLATLSLLAMWVILDRTCHVIEHITVDRDPATGWRAGAMLVATGAITGRAAAGDWESPLGTVIDFVVLGWPAALVLMIAILLERVFGVKPQREPGGAIMTGLLPGLILIALAAAYLILLGWWT